MGVGVSLDLDTDIDATILNRIGSIVIRGKATGDSGHYGIEADRIGRLVVGGVTYAHGDPLTPFDTGFFLDAGKTILVREI